MQIPAHWWRDIHHPPFKFAVLACHIVNFHLCKNFLEILVICFVFLQILCLHCMLWDKKDSETAQNASIEAASTKLLVRLCYLRFWKLQAISCGLNLDSVSFALSKQQLLHGSDRHCFPWSCLELKCDTFFLNKPSLLVCDQSAFTDPTIVTKWEKWEHLDYTQRNMVVPAILQQAQLAQHDGAPLRYEQSKRLVLHCDFSQDLCHAMADQSNVFSFLISSLLRYLYLLHISL